MASGGARRGRRDNGLVAAAYAAAGDVDPRIGEHLLDVLGLRGIAAYLQPASDLHPITRTTTLPSPQTDRLWVDREHLDTARDYLRQLSSPPPARREDEDIEAAFAGIVAGFDNQPDVDEPPWPKAEDVTAEATEVDNPLPRWTRTTVDLPPPDATLLDGLDTFGADLPGEDEEEGYRPPPPPPLPRISPGAIVAVLSIVAGLVLFFNPGILGVQENLTMILGFAGILGGFIALIWRLRSGNDDDDQFDPDDGAVV